MWRNSEKLLHVRDCFAVLLRAKEESSACQNLYRGRQGDRLELPVRRALGQGWVLEMGSCVLLRACSSMPTSHSAASPLPSTEKAICNGFSNTRNRNEGTRIGQSLGKAMASSPRETRGRLWLMLQRSKAV